MRDYISHKRVKAAKIVGYEPGDVAEVHGTNVVNSYLVTLEGAGEPVNVPADVFFRYRPRPGDYLVEYPPDGYLSVSPAKAFEDGYAELVDPPGEPQVAALFIAPVVDAVDIAAICHAANTAFCASHGDLSHKPWDETPMALKRSVLSGVKLHLDDPNASPAASHNAWLAYKDAEGWHYGETKCPERKTHPCMMPFEDLPAKDQAKDHLFKAIVNALRPFTRQSGVPDRLQAPSTPVAYVEGTISTGEPAKLILDCETKPTE